MKVKFLFFFLLISSYLQAQTATIRGVITDATTNEPIDFVTVFVTGTDKQVSSTADGKYSIEVTANRPLQLTFGRTGYQQQTIKFSGISAGIVQERNITLSVVESDIEVTVTDSRLESGGMIQEDLTQLKLLPSTTGNLESVLPHIALGASSGTGGELSSQYNVRGGNYDENLVYVNDFEIYRPQLIRAGQQEGLTFANLDLLQSLSFSSGGFEAKYGDKLSSVLDIKYKLPTKFAGSASGSLLGGSAHVEGIIPISKQGNRLRYLLGTRYKTTRYLLGSLDVKGEYLTNFTDVQAYITYDLNSNWQLGAIGNLNRSVYNFVPEERNTGLGLINFALNLSSEFEGQEIDDFTTSMGGLSLTYLPSRKYNRYFLKFLVSSFQSEENERFDIIGNYSLRQIETNLGSDSFGDVIAELGAGTQQQFVRNYLTSNVSNAEFKGGWEIDVNSKREDITQTHFLQWSTKYQYQFIDDRLNEWERLDSAGYSLRYDTNELFLNSVLKTRNELISHRWSGFVQNTYTLIKEDVREIRLSTGIRATYWSLNGEFNLSPRVQFLLKPLKSRRDISYRLAGGIYVQPPFYRELRNLEGEVNKNVLAQKSFHLVGGATWDFYLGNNPRPFRFIGEAYYKHLWDLVSYDVDNVRIRYAGKNDATGYVTGLDLRLNGEFVEGAESWLNLSFLRAREKLDGIQHQVREIGDTLGRFVNDVPRPTDQFMTFSIFFQDYLPKNENFKMNVGLNIGTGLPYGLLGNNIVYRNTYRFQAYHRVDIGFSYAIWDTVRKANHPNHFLNFTQNAWLSLEIFNLMQVQNVASNTWIKTVFEQQYAIPNYLTSRRINLRFRVEF